MKVNWKALAEMLTKRQDAVPAHEELLYEIVAEEVASKTLKPGIWAKAFSEAGGEQSKAVALYISYRTEQLRPELAAEIQRQMLSKIEEQAAAHDRREEEEKRKRNFLTFTCSHCRSTLYARYELLGHKVRCMKCGAVNTVTQRTTRHQRW